jgi:hypothetical protein
MLIVHERPYFWGFLIMSQMMQGICNKVIH